MEVPYSRDDIETLLKHQTKILRYEELQNYPNIVNLLYPYGSVVILYPVRSETDGHWTALFYSKTDNGKICIEFFDPYGTSIDREFKYIDKYGNTPRYLSRLLTTSPYPVEYNDYDFQQKAMGVNTCGRWVVLRVQNADLTLSQFAHLFRPSDDITTDQLAVLVTSIQQL
jgi:hypothetical protein